MEKKELSKEKASPKKPKKPFFSKRGCIVATLFFLILIFINIYGNPMSEWRKKGHDATAQMDVRKAFTAAMTYFDNYPNGTVSLSELKSYGFIQSSDVNLSLLSGKKDDLKITALHQKGTTIYTIDSNGNISSQKK